MRKLVYLFFAVLISAATFAQKGSVGKAEAYLAKGDIAKAKGEIDVAITIEKNAIKGRTWFARGKIYQQITFSDDETISGLDSEALEKTVTAYEKVLELEDENTPNNLIAGTNLQQIWGEFVNRGGTNYGEEDYAGAYGNFVKSLIVKPNDSTSLLYAGVAAQQSDMIEKTNIHYSKLIELGQASADVYTTVIYIERTIHEDDQAALAVIGQAKEAYPTESKFGQEEISILIALDQLEEAKQKLISSIEADSTNANLYLNLGILYDNLATTKFDEGELEASKQLTLLAKENYENAVKNDPDSYVGNYNLGAILVNIAKEHYDVVRDMDLGRYEKEGPALTEKANGIIKEGLPFMKKATELKPEQTDGLKALQQMYQQLKMMDEAEAILNKIDEIEAGK